MITPQWTGTSWRGKPSFGLPAAALKAVRGQPRMGSRPILSADVHLEREPGRVQGTPGKRCAPARGWESCSPRSARLVSRPPQVRVPSGQSGPALRRLKGGEDSEWRVNRPGCRDRLESGSHLRVWESCSPLAALLMATEDEKWLTARKDEHLEDEPSRRRASLLRSALGQPGGNRALRLPPCPASSVV